MRRDGRIMSALVAHGGPTRSMAPATSSSAACLFLFFLSFFFCRPIKKMSWNRISRKGSPAERITYLRGSAVGRQVMSAVPTSAPAVKKKQTKRKKQKQKLSGELHRREIPSHRFTADQTNGKKKRKQNRCDGSHRRNRSDAGSAKSSGARRNPATSRTSRYNPIKIEPNHEKKSFRSTLFTH